MYHQEILGTHTMTDKSIRSLLIAGALFLLLLLNSIFVVQEGNRAFIVRLGDIVRSQDDTPLIFSPGLHFKAPFVDRAKIIDIKLQSFEEPSSRILTSEQNYMVIVDYYVKWRVVDLVKYFVRTGGRNIVAESLIQQKINDTLRAEFGRKKITEVISGERSNIMDYMKTVTNKRAQELGIEILDVRIKKIDLPQEVSSSVFENMRADRKRVATKHRSDGIAAAEKLRAAADREATVTIATAKKDGAKIRANGDSNAMKIYLKAYSKNKDLFSLLRSLEAYEESFLNNHTTLILGTDSKFFKIMKNG